MMLSHNASRRREEGECLICYSMINYLLMGSHTEPPIATNDQLTHIAVTRIQHRALLPCLCPSLIQIVNWAAIADLSPSKL